MTNIYYMQALARGSFAGGAPWAISRATQEVGALITTGAEVNDQKNALNPDFIALHAALFDASAASPAGSRITQDFANFSPVFAAWQSFWAEDSSVFSASADLDRLADFRGKLRQFQALYKADSVAAGQTPLALPAIEEPADSGGILGSAASTVAKGEGKALDALSSPLIRLALLGLGIFAVVEILPVVLAPMAHKAR